MNAFFFGSTGAQLLGVYQPPRGDDRAGAVLCPPFGWEYLRSHRAFRQLASRLADAAFHTLRFDYFGTGDSAGEAWQASVEQWLDDIDTAVDELKDTSGLRKVSLVGCRLGATLAACAAARRDDIDALVLWDPVVNGASHVAELAAAHPRLGAAAQLAPAIAGAAGAIDVGAFALPPRMCAELELVDLLTMAPPRVTATFTVASEPTSQGERLAASFSSCGIESNWRYVPLSSDGTKTDDFVNTVLPNEILDAIVHYLASRIR